MSNYSLYLLALVVMLPASAVGQSQDQRPIPTPPFVAPMPDNTAWTITVSHQGAGTPPPGARLVVEIRQNKSGTTRERATIWSDGSKSDLWFYRGYRLEQKPGSKTIEVTKSPGDPENVDFTDFQWLNLTRYVGVESANNQSCFHFKASIKPDYVRTSYEYSAYIAIKTKQPVAWDVGQTHLEMTSVEARKADAALTLPPAFAEQLKAYRLLEGQANSYKRL